MAALEILSSKIKGQSRSEEEVDEELPLGEIREVMFQDGMRALGDIGDPSVALISRGWTVMSTICFGSTHLQTTYCSSINLWRRKPGDIRE